jgi:GT2 family glycosyltransferase
MPANKVREISGVLALDVPRYARALLRSASRADRSPGWVLLRNRHEHLIENPAGPGVVCDWQWTSYLHACSVLPALGAAVMGSALRQWPIGFTPRRHEGVPDISFVIPHRGAERLGLLRATLDSIRAQEGLCVECIVVEQSETSDCSSLPQDVRVIRLRNTAEPRGWYKSWAYNIGVTEARAPIVVCHDGDILVPKGYGHELLRLFERTSCRVAFPQRFLFYLTEDQASQAMNRHRLPMTSPERIVQNWKGGTLAIRRDAFFEIGGFDEEFEGWTGEDVEFHDRCLTLGGWNYGYIPFVHLWHPPQPAKFSEERKANLAFTTSVMNIPREDRVARLRERQPWTRDHNAPHPPPRRRS